MAVVLFIGWIVVLVASLKGAQIVLNKLGMLED